MLVCCALAAAGCRDSRDRARDPRLTSAPPAGSQLFTRLPSSYTGVTFRNDVTDTQAQNVFTYRNHYNGGGVALGDLTGDGLPEMVLTSNERGPRLYLNEGKFRFRDVTKESGLHFNGAWTTGVTLADVNGDGLLDIYVCHAGNEPGVRRANELYINQGVGPDSVPTFKEAAAEYGIAGGGYATQAVFFDYDRDGNLDLFLINNSPRPAGSFGMQNTRNTRDPLGGAKLYHNDGNGHFHDVSAKAGIFGSEIGFGLGVVASDVNGDGWPDIYVANDFFERDYLYLNNGDGTFTEQLDRRMPYSSYFSMGLDIADINNDGRPDIYTTDMLPEGNRRVVTTSSFDPWDVYQDRVRTGYHYQFMRNMLQLNNGDGTFSDIAQMAGVARTDWSWSALIADLDLDGFKDIFVTNGVAKDVTSQDYIASFANERAGQTVARGGHVDYMQLVNAMTSTPIPNYAFRNRGDLTFANEGAAWGLDTPGFSNGAAYADLDGDGAIDLVVNNTNGEAFVYRNNARTAHPGNHFLQVRLLGDGGNRYAIGAKVTLRDGARQFYQELEPTRGFQSSSDYLLTFGVGARDTLDSLTVEWPDRRTSTVRRVATNQLVTVRQAESAASAVTPMTPMTSATRTGAPLPPLLADVTAQAAIDFVHHENEFVDFDRDQLIPKMLSTEGPVVAVGDVNGDGLDDFFVGGAKNQPGALLIQQASGRFARSNAGLFEQDAISEDLGAVFFDANGDGRPDLYVVSGGNEFSGDSPALQDRLYLNDGRGRFHKALNSLPPETASGSRAIAADYDGDGDMDLFVGGRVVPWEYGIAPRSMLLQNDGHGHFTDVTGRLAPELAHVGMVTDAAWVDVDGDGRLDLVVVGEWMPITIFHNAGGGRLTRTRPPGLEASHGWWNRIIVGDFTGHGRADFIVGNLGLNTRLRATPREPVAMYVNDFARHGVVEQIVTSYDHGVSYPITMRDDLLSALPFLRTRYPSYASYAEQKVTDIFRASELAGAVIDSAETFATSLVRNNGDGSFTLAPLPALAQIAPVYGLLAGDVDGDGKTDILLGGNFDGVKPEIGRMAASYGLLLRGDGHGVFTPVPSSSSGFLVTGQIRDIQRLRTHGGDLFVVSRNNDSVLVYRPTRQARR